jgi:galactose mutarotase-like enzyme
MKRYFPLHRSWFSYDAQIFDQLKSRSVKLYNPKTGRGVKVDFAGFDYLVVWSSKNGGNFVAIEPWTGLSTCSDEDDVFEHKRGVKILAPNASATHSFDITLL